MAAGRREHSKSMAELGKGFCGWLGGEAIASWLGCVEMLSKGSVSSLLRNRITTFWGIIAATNNPFSNQMHKAPAMGMELLEEVLGGE